MRKNRRGFQRFRFRFRFPAPKPNTEPINLIFWETGTEPEPLKNKAAVFGKTKPKNIIGRFLVLNIILKSDEQSVLLQSMSHQISKIAHINSDKGKTFGPFHF